MSYSLNKPPLPLPVKRAIEKFGRDLSLARRRRRFSQASMAERIGISVASLRRLEGGDPSLSWGAVARALPENKARPLPNAAPTCSCSPVLATGDHELVVTSYKPTPGIRIRPLILSTFR